jgi:hypothetical protein
MTSEGPSESPFAAGYDPASCPEPRLGILHLLGATTCVAVYFGLVQTIRLIAFDQPGPADPSVAAEASGVLYGLGWGLSLGGLVLWFVRRWRGMPFPRHPGEYMLLVEATVCLLLLARGFLSAYVSVMLERGSLALSVPLWGNTIPFVFDLCRAIVWTVAGFRIGIRRWRRFFFLVAVSEIIVYFFACGGFALGFAAFCGGEVLVVIVLAAIVARDHRRGLRYPWSHWAGVAIWFWSALLNLGFLVLSSLRHWL